jgi:very-short-patch-repair endonuclease
VEENKYKKNLYQGAPSYIFQNAERLRKEQTMAEEVLWSHLKNRRLNGKKFRRQHPLDKYVLDFYCHQHKLAVELDGAIHNDKLVKRFDHERTLFLNTCGIKVIRFYNSEVLKNIELVLQKVSQYFK